MQTYDVGGVRLPRPFKIRRLGHFGFNAEHMDESVNFYHHILGFKVSDWIDFSRRAPDPKVLEQFGDAKGYFMRTGGDHHAFVLFNQKVREMMDPNRRFRPGITINQISWQVGSLKEVMDADSWFSEQDIEIQRTGRDMPGSNWHTYMYDPDGHTNELFYGMEQIGWNGHSKPLPMHDRIFHHRPDLPQISEEAEVNDAMARKIDLLSGVRDPEIDPETYDVGGILLSRPFKPIYVGPIGLFVEDVEASSTYYQSVLGLELTETVEFEGHHCVFLRANTEHHSVALYPLALRERLGLSTHSTCATFGVQVASYAQLRAARDYFRDKGVRFVSLPGAIHPGIDYALHILDPNGHCLQIYHAMEQIGWDGRPRPAAARNPVPPEQWPESLPESSQSYLGMPLLGPLG